MLEKIKKVWRQLFPQKTNTNIKEEVASTNHEVASTSSFNGKSLDAIAVYNDVLVYVDGNDTPLDGWVVERMSSSFSVVYTDPHKKLQDISNIPIERPFNRSEIVYKNYRITLI